MAENPNLDQLVHFAKFQYNFHIYQNLHKNHN